MFVVYYPKEEEACVSTSLSEAERWRDALNAEDARWRAALNQSYPSETHQVGRVVPLDRGTVRICAGFSVYDGHYFVLWHDSLCCLGWTGDRVRAADEARFLTKEDARAFAEAHGWRVLVEYWGWDGPLQDESPYARED